MKDVNALLKDFKQMRKQMAAKRRSQPRKTAQIAALESEFRALLGTKVSIQDCRGKGRILIEYYSSVEFERILGMLRGLEPGFGRIAEDAEVG